VLLRDKNAVVYGAAGAIGGAVTRAFARERARVFLSARACSQIDALAAEISMAGGRAQTAEVDALDEAAIEAHLDAVMDSAGRVDVSFNAIGIPQHGVQGTPLIGLPAEDFSRPIVPYARSQFLTARAAARRMVRHGSGVILTLTATPARLAAPLVGGMGPAWAAIEALSRGLAAELGPLGIRVVCLRPDAIPETDTIRTVYGLHADGAGMTRDAFQAAAESMTLRKRLPTLVEVGNVAAFMASDRASAMTATVANLSGGSFVDYVHANG
jgi:NAD(P)-dependent dehydrogenase (short-subunit alcohol dehydrogenase family)